MESKRRNSIVEKEKHSNKSCIEAISLEFFGGNIDRFKYTSIK